MALTLPAPDPRLRACVVIPARDEQAHVGACLRALAAQRDLGEQAWEVILVLDSCEDQTAERAREAWPSEAVALHLVPGTFGGAGFARTHGMDLAHARLAHGAGGQGLIATTDADTRVDPSWLARQLELVGEGAEAIGGDIRLDSAAPEPEARARRRADQLPAAQAQGPAHHAFFGGASMAITSGAYERIGGLEPLAALEDEAFARRIEAGGIAIHRPADVRVHTSARTEGRAARGLAHDLALAEWTAQNSWKARDFDARMLARTRTRSVSVILPAKEVADTVGPIVEAVDALRRLGLVDELLVIDSASGDGTAAVAERAGATVVQEAELMPEHGPCRGKGDAMWRAAQHAEGDLLVFCDTDSTDFDASFVTGVLGPLLTSPATRLVKGSFRRPFRDGQTVMPDGGGRVTELLARPALNLHFPELAGLDQPLAGEIGIERELFGQMDVPAGYGVEVAMLIDALRLAGIEAIGQTDLGTRQNRHQSLAALGVMAYEVLVALHRRLPVADVVPGPLVQPGGGRARQPVCEERPPFLSVESARAPASVAPPVTGHPVTSPRGSPGPRHAPPLPPSGAPEAGNNGW